VLVCPLFSPESKNAIALRPVPVGSPRRRNASKIGTVLTDPEMVMWTWQIMLNTRPAHFSPAPKFPDAPARTGCQASPRPMWRLAQSQAWSLTGPIFDERVRQLERCNETGRMLHVTVGNWHSLHQPDEVLRGFSPARGIRSPAGGEQRLCQSTKV